MNDFLGRLVQTELGGIPRLQPRAVPRAAVARSTPAATIIEEYVEREWVDRVPTGVVETRRIDAATGARLDAAPAHDGPALEHRALRATPNVPRFVSLAPRAVESRLAEDTAAIFRVPEPRDHIASEPAADSGEASFDLPPALHRAPADLRAPASVSPDSVPAPIASAGAAAQTVASMPTAPSRQLAAPVQAASTSRAVLQREPTSAPQPETARAPTTTPATAARDAQHTDLTAVPAPLEVAPLDVARELEPLPSLAAPRRREEPAALSGSGLAEAIRAYASEVAAANGPEPSVPARAPAVADAPVVRIRIGRIEVHATAPAAPVPAQLERVQPALSLDALLRRREES